MSIYLIEHSVKDFTGYFGGVDFYQGRGSTSSEDDAQKLKGLGCCILEPGTMMIESQDKGAASAAPAPSPLPELPIETEKPAEPEKPKRKRPRK